MLTQDEIIDRQFYSSPYSSFFSPVTPQSETKVVELLEKHIDHLICGAETLNQMKLGLEEEILRGLLNARSVQVYEQIFRLNQSRFQIFQKNKALVQKLRENLNSLSQ
jgi:hypothetical protein